MTDIDPKSVEESVDLADDVWPPAGTAHNNTKADNAHNREVNIL